MKEELQEEEDGELGEVEVVKGDKTSTKSLWNVINAISYDIFKMNVLIGRKMHIV